jgi:putative transposase
MVVLAKEPPMLAQFLRCVARSSRSAFHALRCRFLAVTKPGAPTPVAGALADLVRSKPELVAENALLHHQLAILHRSVKRPRYTPTDRALLVLLASRVRAWRSALLIVQPDTLLRWHRQLFRRFWRRKSRPGPSERKPKVSAETIALIREMAAANRLWGAERIRGELRKLDIRVAKWTVQKYMRDTRPLRRAGQTWATFLRNHADTIWACDFLLVTDALFRPVYAFFVVALGSRRVVHVGVTRHPSDAWVAQQLREATPFGTAPRFLIRDNDRKYGQAFTRVAEASGITVLRTAYRAPRQNATCERFLRSVRRECLDHLLVLGEAHLRRVLREYVAYFNTARPHQGLQQRVPSGTEGTALRPPRGGQIQAFPVLGGLHHTYRRAA